MLTTDYKRIKEIVEECTVPYSKDPLREVKRADGAKEVLVFTTNSMEHTSKLVESKDVEKVDMVYIDVGVKVGKAHRRSDELRELLIPVIDQMSRGATVEQMKKLLEMDAYEAMRCMALLKTAEIFELRAPYQTHRGADRRELERLAEVHGLLHIANFKPSKNRIKI